MATIDQSDPYDYRLEWPSAVPGWAHSSGSDTEWVYYIETHVGVSQAFLLVDASAPPEFLPPLQGSYSLAFQSGHFSSPSTPWVNAYLSQTGLVPEDALSLHFLATGNFAVSMNGVPLTPYALGNNEYAVDISPYAGTLGELKIINMNPQPTFSMVTVDDFTFSPAPVPEPSTFLLLAVGALGSFLVRRLT